MVEITSLKLLKNYAVVFTVHLKPLNKIEITLLALNTDKIKRKIISAF